MIGKLDISRFEHCEKIWNVMPYSNIVYLLLIELFFIYVTYDHDKHIFFNFKAIFTETKFTAF